MENHIRIFREEPFGWFNKPIMRYLRKKYGKNRKVFIALRATYLAICEMESDFESNFITAFNKTVGTSPNVRVSRCGVCGVAEERTLRYFTAYISRSWITVSISREK